MKKTTGGSRRWLLVKAQDNSQHIEWSEFAIVEVDQQVMIDLVRARKYFLEASPAYGVSPYRVSFKKSGVEFLAGPLIDEFLDNIRFEVFDYQRLTAAYRGVDYQEVTDPTLAELPKLCIEASMLHVTADHFCYTANVRHTTEEVSTVWIPFKQVFNPDFPVKFWILSPDGFSFREEPYEATMGTYDVVVEATFECIKNKVGVDGYYSTFSQGRIPLQDLENYCKVITCA